MIKDKVILENIRKQYLRGYKEAIEDKVFKLCFDVEVWERVLNDIELKLYHDIKEIGVFMYPYFPIGGDFADFANPFKKIAIIIKYKKSWDWHIKKRQKFFEGFGYTVYILESAGVTHSLEKFYQIQNFTNFYSWEYADLEERKEFLNKFKNQNSQCLITYLKENYSWCTGDIAPDYNALNKQNERMEKWLTVF